MPKPLFLDKEKSETRLSLDSEAAKVARSPMELERLLRRRRSAGYVEEMTRLDAGGHVADGEAVRALVRAVREEFPELEEEQLPLGIVAKCYLAPPHDVHSLDMAGSIIRHYKSSEPLPPALARARGLALHGGYAFIEVYHDCLRAVKKDGTISVVGGD